MKVDFIGLGIMGRPMAGHLQAAGHQLAVRDRGSIPQELIDGGARVCSSASEVAEHSEITILMLPDTPDVEVVLFGRDGVADGLSSGKAVVDMSSIDPIATRRFAQRVHELGCDYVDAPVSGGEVGASNASLTIMCGAEENAFHRVYPLLQTMGKTITRVGGPGDGQVAKVANQIIVALNIEAVAEALVFAAKAGADPAKVREALMGGFASSRVLEVHGERMVKRTFEAGFRIALHQKDLNLALGAARSLGLALPNTASTQQLFSACVAHGGAGWDHSAIVRAIELLAAHQVTGN
jgi:2-hydroxy-3-oxopropionate reductase